MMDGEYSVWKKYENVLLVRKNGRALNQGHSFFFFSGRICKVLFHPIIITYN